MLRRMYDWCVAAAYKPFATWIMGAVSFVESSIFPIPPDVMLIPMSLARPDRAYYYAFICTWTSVAGGVLGYAIGALIGTICNITGPACVILSGEGVEVVDTMADAIGNRRGRLGLLGLRKGREGEQRGGDEPACGPGHDGLNSPVRR